MAIKRVTFVRPFLYPKQFAAIYSPARYSICEASTKSGKTFGCLAWITELSITGAPHRNYWWIAPTYGVAKIAYTRLKTQFTPGLFSFNDSEQSATALNKAKLWFKGADNPDNLYGEDVWGAVMDEATRCKEASWHALRSTLTYTKGPVRIIGNVKGRKNWAWKLGRMALDGAPGMEHHKITAQDAVDAGVLDAEEIEDAKRALPDAVFRQLYYAEPADDEGNPFGITAIRSCMAPLSLGQPTFWGWDLAKSVDWTVGIPLDNDAVVCRLERFQSSWEETTARILRTTGSTPALVDSTGVGDPILEQLQAKGIRPNYSGFKFTSASKQQLMEGLAVAIQQRKIRFPEGVIVDELENFEYVYTKNGCTYSAPEGMHDDCVCALALAVKGHGHQTEVFCY